MKKSIFKLMSVLPAIAVILFITVCDDKQNDSNTGTGSILKKNSLTLTIGASEKLEVKDNYDGTTLTWSSSDSSVVRVDPNGTVTALKFTNSSTGTGEAVITVKNANGDKDTISITTTMAAQVDILNLPPMKDQFSDYFMLGNIFNPGDVSGGKVTNSRLTRHYNVLTAENNMKPQYIASSQNSYNFTTADSMVNAAIASGFKIVGHTLLWHSQNASWMNNITDKDTALAAMKKYITDVVTHFKGRIYSWDVLNEVFPDGGYTSDWKTSMRTNNPWYKAIGSDFVYEGFLAARLADPDAILYYNDYNLDNSSKAAMVRDMVRAVNQKYAEAYPNENRKLIEGIGMQSHHNINVTVNSIKTTLNLFKQLGVKISISEIDVLSQSWNDYSNSTAPTNGGKLTAAILYGDYFKQFIDYADIIERVTFWGVYDSQSWRARGLPLLFEGGSTSKAKPAYYKVIEALGL